MGSIGSVFQRAPTLGGECYVMTMMMFGLGFSAAGFNGHPPLGVNATSAAEALAKIGEPAVFQRAPTLGGECYVDAATTFYRRAYSFVSTGTHPWG